MATEAIAYRFPDLREVAHAPVLEWTPVRNLQATSRLWLVAFNVYWYLILLLALRVFCTAERSHGQISFGKRYLLTGMLAQSL